MRRGLDNARIAREFALLMREMHTSGSRVVAPTKLRVCL